MIGAIIGDVCGSAREWKRIKTEDFELFIPQCKVTDDSVMSTAMADASMNNKPFDEAMREWGKKYPNAGYGGMFRKWLKNPNMKAYHSFGNGSAMRVSPIGWMYDTLDETLDKATETALPTHDHYEGVKGAQSIAAAIFLARNGKTKQEIKQYIEDKFNYNLNRKIDDIRPNYHFDSTCMGSVPESIICFLEANDYESTIRKAISLGGDADTQACISGSIAEAFYGVPNDLKLKVDKFIPRDMFRIISKFDSIYCK